MAGHGKRALALIFAALLVASPAFAQSPTISNEANTVFRDYNTDGQALSGVWNPRKSDIRHLFSTVAGVNATVLNNTALLALPTTSASLVTRMGYSTPGDSPEVLYTASSSACSLNSGNGDNGSQVKSADNKCWLANFSDPTADVRIWGAAPNTNVDVPLQAAINWACSTHIPLVLPYTYTAGQYLISSQVTIGNGSPTQLSTCNDVTFKIVNPDRESTSGTTPPLGMPFRYNGAANGNVPLFLNGPAKGINVSDFGVDCNGICATGILYLNIINGVFTDNSVERATGPGQIITSRPVNTWGGAMEGSRFSGLRVLYPSAGGSGIRIGDVTCTTCNTATIANQFDDFTVNYDGTSASAFGLQFGFASQNTFTNMRITYDPNLVGSAGKALSISPPPGAVTFPTDNTFIHPLFTGTIDPGPVGWAPVAGGFHFVGWSTVGGAFPTPTTLGNFSGTDSLGNIYGGASSSWTPSDGSTAGLTLTAADAVYTRSGNRCTVEFNITWPTTSDTNPATLAGIPCPNAASGTGNSVVGGAPSYTTVTTPFTIILAASATAPIAQFSTFGGSILRNVDLSGKTIRASITYLVN